MADLTPMEQAPKFTSNVPENIRHAMSKDEFQTWLADTLSVNDQRVEWLTRKLMEVNNATVENSKQIKIWKKYIENPVAIFIAVAIWLGPFTISKILSHAEQKPVAPAVAPNRDTPVERLQPDPKDR